MPGPSTPDLPDAGPAAGAGEVGRPRPPRRGYLVPGAIALVALAAIAAVINFAGLEHHSPRTLVGPDVATYIVQGMEAAGDRSAPTVHCPPSEPVRAGVRFTCTLQSPGMDRPVQVTETNDSGNFTWRILGRMSGG